MYTKLQTECPIARVAIILSDPWTMLIIRDVLRNEKRFCDLERSLSGISTRTLTLKLKQLEAEGIIEKKDVRYTITKQGKKLQKILDAMASYGKMLTPLSQKPR